MENCPMPHGQEHPGRQIKSFCQEVAKRRVAPQVQVST